MIKTIIKRDGTRVPFDADKLNRWGQWAATNLNRYVDWSMVVRETAKRSSETIKSSDLQETLIKVCLEQESYSYNKMAGRLYCGNWRKQLFKKDDIPTIKQVQERLYRAGLMKKMAYSDDEYAELETVINHDLDLQSSYSELQFSRQKYCLQNRVTKAEYETPQFMYMRMAMALFEDFPDRMVHVKKMYAMLSQKKVSAPTPAYVHLGTRMSGFSSCCLFKSGDSIQSLAAHDHIAYMMTSMGAGLGSMLDTRTAGDKVRGGAIKHMGKLPYLRALETSTHANRQCYAEGTDILTDRGFVNFKDVTKEMRIAQVDNQHHISFVTPQAIQQYDVNDGEMIQFLSSKGGPGWLGVYHPFMLVTPEHRMMAHVYDALRGYATEEYIPILAKDYPIRATNRIMDVGAYANGEHDEFTDLDRLWAIYQTRYGVYTGNSVRDFRFYGNDETEADFLTMLKRMHARFNIEPSNEGKSRIIHVYDQRHLSKGGFPFSLSDRTASWCEQCVSFMTDLTHTGRHRSVYKNLELVRQIQSLAACANLRTTASLMPEYVEPRLKLKLMFGKSNAFRMRVKTESIQYTGKVYCVTVPEGRVVVRYNGRTCVSGNSGRGGSATSYFNCFDPEAETICNLKNPLSTDAHRIRGLDYGFSYNRFFARKAADDKDVFTFTSYSAPDLFAAFYSGDPQKFADLYAKYEADASFKKTYISARKLLTVALQQAYETGRIYQFNADEANRHTPFKDPIYQSNLCVAGDTKILTDKGEVTISEYVGKKVNVWNGEEWSEVTVMKTGENQELWDVCTDSGDKLTCTPYHNWWIVKNYWSAPVMVKTVDLKPGTKLMKFVTPVIAGDQQLSDAYVNGFYSGDGCLTPAGQRIYLYGEKRALESQFPDGSKWIVQPEQNRMYKHYHSLHNKFFVPLPPYDVQSRVSWLAGYLDADGTVHKNGDSQVLVAGSVNREFLGAVKEMLSTIGVSSKIRLMCKAGIHSLPTHRVDVTSKDYPCQSVWRIEIAGSGIRTLLSLNLPVKRILLSARTPQRDAQRFVKIVSCQNSKTTGDTYCFTEPKRHRGVFNGILTGQCTEVFEPTEAYEHVSDLYNGDEDSKGEVALCSLAAINLGNVTDAEYEEVAYYALLLIDRCILMNDYPLPQVGIKAKARMSAGVSMIDLAHYLAKNHVSYSSPEGKALIHRVAERHSYNVIKASLRLGKELGNAPWMNRTKWPDGWLPIDTYNKSVDKMTAEPLHYDWEGLRKEIIANGGIRNSVTQVSVPAESSSVAVGATNGLYPIRSWTLIKTNADNTTYWAAPDSDRLHNAYEIAWDVPTKDLIEMYAIVQKFMDQGISADLYRKLLKDDTIGTAEMLTTFFLTMPLKSRYYMNIRTTEIKEEPETQGCESGACTL